MAKKKSTKKAAPRKATTTKKTTPKKKVVKKVVHKARPAPRRVSLGLPSKAPKTVEAAEGDSKDQSKPPAGTSQPAAAGGTVVAKDGGGFVVTIVREFTADECKAIENVTGGNEGDDIADVLLGFCAQHLEDAIADAEADTADEQSRYDNTKD